MNITDTEKIKTDVGGQPIPFQYIIIFDDKFTANPNSLATTFQALSLIVESLGGEVILYLQQCNIRYGFQDSRSTKK